MGNELRFNLLWIHAGLEACVEVEEVEAFVVEQRVLAIEHRLNADWHPEIGLVSEFVAEEFRRSDANDGHRNAADSDGGSDNGRIAAEFADPGAVV